MRGSNPSRSEEGALILEFCPGRLAEQKAGTDRIDVDVIGVAEHQIRLPSWPSLRFRLLNSMRCPKVGRRPCRSEEHTSELPSLMRISYAVICLKQKRPRHRQTEPLTINTYVLN